MHFDDFYSSNFDPQVWPEGLVNVRLVVLRDRQSGRIKLLHINIMHFKDNSSLILFINFTHAVGNLVFYRTFSKAWAEEMHAMETGELTAKTPFLFDCAVMQQSLPTEHIPLSSMKKVFLTQPNSEAEKLTCLQPHECHLLILEKMCQNDRCQHSLFRIRMEKFNEFSQKVNCFAPSGMHFSANNILVSLIAKIYAQAYKAVTATSELDHNR
ncbi:hypothetical protein DL89DRAFT_256035 [Linderina pennispora]|uniref:Uncharacterized protein n=1 Tax=Linderina pennispora TaxID=61395 RepID=A0A1Y1WG81_9FUNG|nr:uncharacterized protein DL89DRAFT_256035 [Linderina pennispora]ORX72405.1 hypothetical protein DL89DRAFT_256035 [Linderina pennispora]